MGIIFGSGGLLESIFNPSSWWDKFKNGETNVTNREIAEENLDYQRERNEIEDKRYEDETAYNRAFAEDERDYQRAFAENNREYERALQQEIFNREDTAIERQASQLSALGINPASQQMNGLGSGAVVSSTGAGSSTAPTGSTRAGSPLHNDFQMQDMGVLSAVTPLMSLFQGASDMMTGNLQRDSLREQNDYQRLLNESQAIENEQKRVELEAKLNNINADTENKKANTKTTNELRPYEVQDKRATSERNQRENIFQEKHNVTDLTDKYVRIATDIAAASGNDNMQDFILDEPKTAKKYVGKTLKHTYEVVSNALANTIGKGASSLFNSLVKRQKNNKNKRDWSTFGFGHN